MKPYSCIICMDKILGKFENIVMYFLIFIGMLFVLYQIIDLSYVFATTMYACARTGQFFPEGGGLQIGAVFFNILLTMEIIETVKVFSKDHKNKLRVILLVGLIAVTRKILLLDFTHAQPMEEIATSVMIVALSLGYFLISRVDEYFRNKNSKDNSGDRDGI